MTEHPIRPCHPAAVPAHPRRWARRGRAAAAVVAVVALAHAPASGAAPSAPASVVPSGRLAGLRQHIVAPGETMAAIARRYGVSAERLRAANGMSDTQLYAGARILLDPPNGAVPTPGGGAGPAASANGRGTYTIVAGDSLSRIAKRQGTTVAALAEANGIRVDSVILPGQQLVIPGAAPATAPASQTQGTTTVVAGDSFARIAQRHHVTVAALVAANGLSTSSIIHPGDRLVVPTPTGGTATGGGLTCPVPGAAIHFDWGFPREGGRYHEGIDIFAAAGTPVRAPVDGTVEAGSGATPGRYVVLLGRDGWQYFAAHLQRYGETGAVRAGEIIGYVGATGNAAGSPPHLHLEMRPQTGRPANPYRYLRQACG